MLERKFLFYDLTQVITEDMVVFPGDPVFQKNKIKSIENGCCFNLFKIEMGNHMGTHIDFPVHVIKDGKSSSDYSVNDFVGDGIIIDVPETADSITESFLLNEKINNGDIVFFKTAQSIRPQIKQFSEKFVYIEEDAANYLIGMGVRVVGIDSISVDAYQNENLPVHNSLLSNDILIVEGLKLIDVVPGRCHIIIAPLNIPKMDGLPAKVLMWRD